MSHHFRHVKKVSFVFLGFLRYSIFLLLIPFWWISDYYAGRELRAVWIPFEFWIILGATDALTSIAFERWPQTIKGERSRRSNSIHSLNLLLSSLVVIAVVVDELPGQLRHKIVPPLIGPLIALTVLLLIAEVVVTELDKRRSKPPSVKSTDT